MKWMFCLLLSSLTLVAMPQDNYAGAKAAVMDYIEGTAHGELDQLRNAFHPMAALYTVGQGDSIRRIPIDTYIGYFKPGRETGRQGHIVSIDVVNNAASAIVEIDMGDRRFTDYILLLRLHDGWKIIQKSYTNEPYQRKGKLLFVVSSADTYGETGYTTGAHFGEIVEPYDRLSKAGYEIDFVSPEGGMVPVHYVDLQDPLQRSNFYDHKLNSKLKRSLSPEAVDVAAYDGLYLAGGSGAMFDLPADEGTREIIRAMYEDQQGVVAAVCHGPAGLFDVKLSGGNYLVDGKEVSAFTNAEEGNLDRKREVLPFLLESKLKERGAKFSGAAPGQPHVVVDGRLVTGQNPASCAQLAEEMIRLLEDGNLR
jgi:putative intracellular protease/amidase